MAFQIDPEVRKELIESYMQTYYGRRKLLLSMIHPLEVTISVARPSAGQPVPLMKAETLEELEQLLSGIRALADRVQEGSSVSREELQPLIDRYEVYLEAERDKIANVDHHQV